LHFFLKIDPFNLSLISLTCDVSEHHINSIIIRSDTIGYMYILVSVAIKITNVTQDALQ